MLRQQTILVGFWRRSSQAGEDLRSQPASLSVRTAICDILNKAQAQVTIASTSSKRDGDTPRHEPGTRRQMVTTVHPFQVRGILGSDAENAPRNEGVESVQIKVSARHGHLSEA